MSRLDTLRKLYETDNDQDADLPYMIALQYKREGQLADALAWLEKTTTTHPSHHYAWYQQAQVLAAMDQTEQAIQIATTGLAQAKTDGNTKAASELQALLDTL